MGNYSTKNTIRTPYYENGIHTHNRIVAAAANILYYRGLNAFTISNIARMADVPSGLVNYYFKKGEMIGYLYVNYRSFISRQYLDAVNYPFSSPFKRSLGLDYKFYFNVLSNDRLRELYIDCFRHDYLRSYYLEQKMVSLTDTSAEFDLYVTESVLHNLCTALYGMEKELILQKKSNLFQSNAKSLSDFLSSAAYKLLGINTSFLNQCLTEIKANTKEPETSLTAFIQSILKTTKTFM